MDDELFTVDEVAEHLKVSSETVRRLVWRGDLTVRRVGRNLRFTQKDIDLYLESIKEASTSNESIAQ